MTNTHSASSLMYDTIFSSPTASRNDRHSPMAQKLL